MTFLAGFSSPIPANADYTAIAEREEPLAYTSVGPLPLENGLAFTKNSIIFDASRVEYGDLDCGLFGSQA